MGFEFVKWDGKETRPLLDSKGTVFAVLAGQPNDTTWADNAKTAAEAMGTTAVDLQFAGNGQRGNFDSATVGVSFGGGQTVTSWSNYDALRDLLMLDQFLRLVGFANGIFSMYAPLVYSFYHTNIDALFASNRSLIRNFPRAFSTFTAATFNFGPNTITYPHIDALNLAWGWCCITALGFFNPDLGGHLILWDLKLVIRFPPGSTILIPSALLHHSNIPIQYGETRYSFTQFAAAGLFRWVHNGFKTDKSWNSMASKEQKQQRTQEGATRQTDGCRLFSKWDDLVNQ
ncbi:hypothetical protein C8J57DRAFT_1085443 [Mycena rebaudengoi]|nr:hypothetical protein C8J57DRAFT_1085443 [Mycena rebaudengoi]